MIFCSTTRAQLVGILVPVMLILSAASGHAFSSFVSTIERACGRVGLVYKTPVIQQAIESADCAICHDHKSFGARNSANAYWFAFEGMRDTGQFCISSVVDRPPTRTGMSLLRDQQTDQQTGPRLAHDADDRLARRRVGQDRLHRN